MQKIKSKTKHIFMTSWNAVY